MPFPPPLVLGGFGQKSLKTSPPQPPQDITYQFAIPQDTPSQFSLRFTFFTDIFRLVLFDSCRGKCFILCGKKSRFRWLLCASD